jgi:hypothetical protein
VVLGASNARNLVPFLQGRGFSVTDLTVPGWVASDSNIESLISKLKELSIPNSSAVVIDLLSNSTYRYEQFDGSLALPYKEGGGYHMPGSITVCSESNFKRIMSQLQPILLSCQTTVKIILPPMPRYVGGGCCGNPTHSTNVGTDDHAATILSKIANLRAVQKEELLKMGAKNFWLLDGVASILGYEPKRDRPSTKQCADKVKIVIGRDNVHFTREGYENIAQCIFVSILGMFKGTLTKSERTSAVNISGTGLKKPTFFWRGFASPVGAPGLPENSSHKTARFHPYKRTGRKN